MKTRHAFKSMLTWTATALLLGLVGCLPELPEPPSAAQVSPLQTPPPPTTEVEPTAPSETWPTLTPPPTPLPPPQWTPAIKPTPTPKLLPTRPPLRLSPTPAGSPPADLQSLYYVADNNGKPELRVIGMDMQGRKWLESKVVNDLPLEGSAMALTELYPSPDGKYLAGQIVHIDAGPSVVSIVERSSGRTWCPFVKPARCLGSFDGWISDNQMVLYLSSDQSNDVTEGFWVVNLDTGPYRLLDLPTHPRWGYSLVYNLSPSADGQRMAYSITYVEDNVEVSEIWIMRINDGTRRFVRKVKGVINPRTLSWSPVGEQLIYIYQNQPGGHLPSELWLVNTDGSGERLLATDLAMPGEWRFRPVWSPDGRHVAFVRLDDPTTYYNTLGSPWSNVHVVDTTTGHTIKLSRFEKRVAGFATWSPDGKFVAFVSATIEDDQTRYGEVWVASADGSQLYAVSGTAEPNDALAWLPSVPSMQGR